MFAGDFNINVFVDYKYKLILKNILQRNNLSFYISVPTRKTTV